MSRIAPSADRGERLRIARALGLAPLRLRGGRPQPPRLRIVCSEPISAAAWSSSALAGQLLEALQLSASEVSFAESADAPVLELPALSDLRASAQLRRALWPRLRALRRELRERGQHG